MTFGKPAPCEASVVDDEQVAARAGAVAEALAAIAARPGDVVAVMAGNGSGFVAARDAATAGDLVLAPINPKLGAGEIGWIVELARPRALIVDAGCRDQARAALALVGAPPPVIVVDDLTPGARTPAVRARGAGATLLFTSGTTGRPKGCLRSADQEAARIAELTATYGLRAEDVHLIVCPLAHSAPGIFLRACRAVGARTAIAPRFDAAALLEQIATHRASVIFLVPTQWERLLALPDEVRARADWSSVRAAIVAGAPIAARTKARILAWIGAGRLWEFYGSSETGTVTVVPPDGHLARAGSVGRPPPGVEVRLLDDAGAPVAVGATGEVWVRSPAVMTGYLGDDGVARRPDERDGFISVGDLGRVDADGWLWLVDRKHDTIITGGVNVYPAEVEHALADHPAVAGAVAFGIDDPEWGQLVAAVVALRPDVTPAPSRADLRTFLRGRIAHFKVPRALALCTLDELPIGGSGKALRRAALSAFSSRLVP